MSKIPLRPCTLRKKCPGYVGVCAIWRMCHLANEPFGECAIWRMCHMWLCVPRQYKQKIKKSPQIVNRSRPISVVVIHGFARTRICGQVV
jgi:hypothetical protein